jgi:hypothetical protein
MNNRQAINRLIKNNLDDIEAIRHVQTYGTLLKDIMNEITRYQVYKLLDKYIEIEMTLGEYDAINVWHIKQDFLEFI